MDMNDLLTELAKHTSLWRPDAPIIRATTPHGTYTFDIERTSVADGVITLHLVEVVDTPVSDGHDYGYDDMKARGF